VLRAIAFYLFLVPKLYFGSLTTGLVVCNLCYEGSLVPDRVILFFLIINRLYSPVAKKSIAYMLIMAKIRTSLA
jgi:hypothetical protein